MNRWILLGILFVVLALSLPYVDEYIATAVIDATPPDFTGGYFLTPSYEKVIDPYRLSENKDEPNPLPEATSGDIYINLIETNLDYAEVKVTGNGYDSGWLRLRSVEYDSDYNMHTLITSWTVPSGRGILYTFTFRAYDRAGNNATEERYAVTGIPEGYFTINGIKVTTQTTIYLNTREVIFEFHATSLGELIDDVIITITAIEPEKFDEEKHIALELEEVELNKRWEAKFIFPFDGTFLIRGQIGWDGQAVVILSVTLNTGIKVDHWALAQLALGVLGVGLIIYGVREWLAR